MNYESLSKLVREARIIKRISQRELARRTGVDNNTISKIEKGNRLKPNILILKKLSLELGLDFEKMMQLGREFVEFKPKEPKVFYIWGHSYEMDFGTDYWFKLEEFFKLISNKEDIFYGTNKEVLL